MNNISLNKNLVYLVLWLWKTAQPERLSSHITEKHYVSISLRPTLIAYQPCFLTTLGIATCSMT